MPDAPYVGMLKKIFAVAAIFASACIGDGLSGSPGSLPTDETPDPGTETVPVSSIARERLPDPTSSQPVCDLLPQDDSACAHACEPNALLGYIPAGTCATFTCPLADGTTYMTGGCN